MSTALDVATGLAFVFLTFSILSSALVEWLSAAGDRRAKFLKRALAAVLGKPLTKALLEHPVICGVPPKSEKGLSQPPPSYLAPKQVAIALADIARRSSSGASKEGNHCRLDELIRALKSELVQPNGPAVVTMDQEVLFRVEQWFTEQMNRTTASYKRWTQLGTLTAALILTLAFNIDSGRIAQKLYSDAAARAALATAASSQVTAKTLAQLEPSIDRLDALPLGWTGSPWDLIGGETRVLLATLAGWAISILAIGFGAPFWFDTLNRLVSLRQTGPRPDNSIVV